MKIVGPELEIELNPQQEDVIQAPVDKCLWVVAGPGSGKTATLALRVLKLILVDEVEPSGIIATTFTRRGAAELRSRILGWGNRLIRALGLEAGHINLNQIVTGTLDSIVREVMSDLREPALPAPTVIEEFVSQSLMIRTGLLESGLFNDPGLRDYLVYLRGSYGLNVGAMAEVLCDIRERIVNDQVDFSLFREKEGHRPGVEAVCRIIQMYEETLRQRLLCDYAELERQFLEQLDSAALDAFLSGVRYVLVDEYQDTNRLQEKIYLKLAEAAYTAGGGITVVGDDDQSL
ncbi:MAG: UvrD-helicase domain-containing protein, partial [Chloroflexi bacterium]|nr:UvrD-helicase domain-containing protein [Chloroflexota bacterium]